jgi:hypothetical protein
MKFPNYTLGLFTGFCLAALYFMVPSIIEGFSKPAEPQPEPKRFEVVAKYEECNVVRYDPDYSARYSYFLDCRK